MSAGADPVGCDGGDCSDTALMVGKGGPNWWRGGPGGTLSARKSFPGNERYQTRDT